MLRDASLAIQAAKSAGGNRVEKFEPGMHEQAVERLELESDLRAALERDELEVYYQPVVDLRTGGITGVEALVRWNHPQLGFLLPGRFIDIAEQTGLVVELGYQVLAQACSDAKSWLDTCTHRSDLTLAVNVSARQVVQGDFVERVIRTMKIFDFPPPNLVIEITERVLVAELAEARDKLTRLREMGVRIALDDFGTGYTSLQYLQSLPVDTLKIDRCFVDGVARRADLEVIVRSVLSLAAGLGYEVIAEGVERDDDADLLRELGCVNAQGFGLYRPVSSSLMWSLLGCADAAQGADADALRLDGDAVRAPSLSGAPLETDGLLA
jgi:EAL domain-containing protein (putative c-di-GMP-specific phosphodiesterase class I)